MGSVIATSGKQKGEYLPFGQRINVIGRDKVFPLQALDALVLLKYWRLVILQMIINGALLALSTIATPYTVYPRSDTITGIRFRMDTVKHCAPGNNKCAFESDNWAITWADDDHQYASWGDGGGFDGDNQRGRVSMGIARIEGSKNDYSAFSLNGGVHPESGTTTWPDDGAKGGKCYGILSIDLSEHGGRKGTLYLLRAGWKSGIDMFRQTELWKSIDHGLTWTYQGVRWTFDGSEGFFCPTFCQFGKDYDGGGEYVYIYVPEVTRSVSSDLWNVQKPGKISLMRCKKQKLEDIGEYEYFAGLNNNGHPTWSGSMNDRKAVFRDSRNGVMRTSVIYNKGIGRYILITQQVSRKHGENGHIGIYEASKPWGEWKTVLFANPWCIGLHQADQKKKTVYWNISSKWLSVDGKEFTLVYTGPGSDQWGTVEGTFTIKSH